MNIETTTAESTTGTAIGYIPCYRLPFLSLFHADCMEIMKQYPDKYFDLAIVDPPYGINASKGTWGSSNKGKVTNYGKKDWDKQPPTDEYFVELRRVSKNQIIWGGNYYDLPKTKGWVIWKKMDIKNDFNPLEMAWTSNLKMSFFDFLWCGMWQENMKDKEKRIHPTQKPQQLYSFILKQYATEGMKILDTHFGSGSIALAVDKANRLDKMNLHLTACEIDKEYIDKAIKRISESIKQGTLSF
jgi:site-specific DNA-methyltransferase (adenine-specific)